MRALWVLAVSSTMFGCNTSSSPEPASTPPKVLPSRRAPEPIKDPEPVAKKIDLSLGEGFEMRHPIIDGRVTIIPIVMTHATPMQKFTTLHDGMRRGVVTPMRRSLPALTSELTVAMPWNAAVTSLPATPMAACVAPL